RGLGLVLPLELAVHALVEGRLALGGQWTDARGLERQACGLRRAHEHGGKELVDAPAAELLPRGARLGLAARRERHVDPAGEAVLQVPLRLAVPQEEQIRHGGAIARSSPACQPSLEFACPGV